MASTEVAGALLSGHFRGPGSNARISPASDISGVDQRNQSSIEIFKPTSETASTKQAPSSSAFG